tara:strand:- start:17094 stop:18182 length:1089 start_codon:yes stop_codon:yes gene_type:complete
VEVVVTSALPSPDFWRGRRVFLTGHTGFKGGWMALWLHRLGAEVGGYSLPPSTTPSLFEAARVEEACTASVIGDIRDTAALGRAFDAFRPDIVIHMAAQPLVRASYADPLDTYSTNVMGTANLLEQVRTGGGVAATLIVTTDKCYENLEQMWPYRETDRLGGKDPYSNSKACAELVTQSYWWSFFSKQPGQALGSGRAGNVVGGGDWSQDRLVPDLVAAFAAHRPAILRRPEGVRPWQHVLEPVCGYLLAVERLVSTPAETPPAWNFGPNAEGNIAVGDVADMLVESWGGDARYEVRREPNAVHEATLLTLDHTKARQELNWTPRWSPRTMIEKTADWYRAFGAGDDMRAVSMRQLDTYIDA